MTGRGSVVAIIFILCFFVSKAQDFHLSQFEASPMYLNPAMTGGFEGSYRVSLHYRNQWRNISTKAFTTSALSFDMPFKKNNNLKGGFVIINNRAGAGNYNSLNVLLSGAYDYSLKRNTNHHFVPGVQFGMIHKSVNIDALMFGSQYTPQNGGGLNPAIPNGEVFNNQSIFLPDLNAGLLYFFSSDVSRFNPFIGGSAFHLTQPKESFYGVNNRLPRRYLLHAGTKYNISQKIQVSAYLLGMQQVNDREFTTGLFGYYYLKNSDSYLMIGNTYRNKDALLIHLGLKYREFVYRFSYDINTSALNAVTNGKGGFEMSIVYIIKNLNPEPIQPCPRL